MWDALAWISWVVAAIVFIWLAWDFFRVNAKYDESVLLSSREGVDELFSKGE